MSLLESSGLELRKFDIIKNKSLCFEITVKEKYLKNIPGEFESVVISEPFYFNDLSLIFNGIMKILKERAIKYNGEIVSVRIERIDDTDWVLDFIMITEKDVECGITYF
jgi:hypothetical protein